jgi:predicted nucleic acid-binding protein
VVVETTTVLSHKASQALAIKFLQVVNRGNIPIIHINEELQQAALKIFAQQTKKGTSVLDCSNITVMQKFNVPSIASFDKVYKKSFGLKVSIKGYFEI